MNFFLIQEPKSQETIPAMKDSTTKAISNSPHSTKAVKKAGQFSEKSPLTWPRHQGQFTKTKLQRSPR